MTEPAGDLVSRALANPSQALEELDRIECEESLLSFVRSLWHVLEPPSRPFIEGWAVRAICEHLEAVSSGQIRKLLINVPPGAMKSLTTCVFWPAWEWGPRNQGHLRYVCASYADALTIRDNQRCRRLILSERYQRRWGSRFAFVGDQNAKMKFETNKTGFKIATSVGGLGTGERGDRFIVDDPHNIKDGESTRKRDSALQWFSEVVPTRVNDPEKSAFVVIMQRVHENDVSGLILKEKGYEHLCLPMEFEAERRCSTSIGFRDPRAEDGELLWPERFSRKYLDEDLKPRLRAWGGTYAEAGQLQQRPAPRGGGLFQKADFNFLDTTPDDVVRWCRGWDLAGSKEKRAAFTAGVKMGRTKDGRIVIADVRRGQWRPFEVQTEILNALEVDGPGVRHSIPQDPGQAGVSQKDHFIRHFHGHDVHFSTESGSKEDRARPLAAQSEAGNLYLVRGSWNDSFVAEATSFPNGEFKDQVDAASRAYADLVKKRERMIGDAPTVIGG